jgi:magnesium transporter
MVRGIALGELRWSNSRKALFKEVTVGVLNGLAIGVVVALAALLWKGDPILGIVLGMSMIVTLVVAAVAGTLVPLALRWLNIDPALASSVFVTTTTDVCGFLFFLGSGMYLLSRFS